MTAVLHAPGVYLDDFEASAATAHPALAPTRRAALDRFAELGFPTLRHEDWRFTNVAPIAATPFRLVAGVGGAGGPAGTLPAGALAGRLLDGTGWPRLVFVNGRFDAGLSSRRSLPAGVTAVSLAAALAGDGSIILEHLARHASIEQHPFTALNTAFLTDGACIHVPRGTVIEQPIHVVHAGAGGAGPGVSHPRTLIVAGPTSQVTVIEQYLGAGAGPFLSNAVTEIVAADGAVIDHYKVVREPAATYHVGATWIRQDRQSTVRSHTITIGGALVRNNVTTVLDGEGGHCTLNGLYLTAGREHVDNFLVVEHVKPHCDSREFFKGVLDGASRAVFSGRIVVHKDAQKTDAKQTNMNLLLSDAAQVDTKPQLEILADDVKCTHGATIGQIDEEAIFYLRARGIAEAAARGVLIYAFAAESLDAIEPEPLRRSLQEALLDRLPQGHLLREAT